MASALHHRRRAVLLSGSILGIALAGAGCETIQAPETVGSINATASPEGEHEGRREVDVAGALYKANPDDPELAIRYARALRGIGERTQSSAVLEQASIRHPDDYALLGAYGRALAEAGNNRQALEVLNRAHTPDEPDWRILSVQGAVLDQLGEHDEARRYYASALKLAPDEPSVLSNLGLSYALSKKLAQAEETLRRAVSRPGAARRVRQNLALIVGLEGRFQEAETIARTDLPPEKAAANVAYLRQMLSQRAADRTPGGASDVATGPARRMTLDDSENRKLHPEGIDPSS
jgi:Flp pilus assembly protein TadD